MKAFLITIASALVVFIAGAVVEERETFTRNWFARTAPDHGSREERRDAADAVYVYRTMSAHLYGSGGDARFLERLPASKPISDELRSDAEYLRSNSRIEVPRLVRIEFLTSDVRKGTEAEVTTREYWVTQFQFASGAQADPPRSDITYSRYRLNKDGSRWIVIAWDPVDPPSEEALR